MERLISGKAPRAIGAYSVATKVEDVIYTSGQIAIDPDTNQMVEDDIKMQTHQVINNLKNILEENGSKLENIIKTNVFLTDIKEFNEFNEVYAQHFGKEDYPSRTAIEISALPNNAKIEIDVIAIANK